MKNFLKLNGILALIMAVGFSFLMVACPAGDEEELVDPGKLTIVGFDVLHEGWLVEAEVFEEAVEAVEADPNATPPVEAVEAADAFFLFAASSYKEKTKDVIPGEIKNRRVSLNVWISKGGEPVTYEGNDEELEIKVFIFDPTSTVTPPVPVEGKVIVSFINGVGIGEFVPNP